LPFVLVIGGTKTAIAQAGSHSGHAVAAMKPVDIVRDPTDVPPPTGSRAPAVVHVTLTAKEVLGSLDPSAGTTYRYWTFNGKVPGPMIRVRQGDTIEVTLQNDARPTRLISMRPSDLAAGRHFPKLALASQRRSHSKPPPLAYSCITAARL